MNIPRLKPGQWIQKMPQIDEGCYDAGLAVKLHRARDGQYIVGLRCAVNEHLHPIGLKLDDPRFDRVWILKTRQAAIKRFQTLLERWK